MNATLFGFDAAQWGALAFSAFLATLGYCTAYLMGLRGPKVGPLELSPSEEKRLVHPLLVSAALLSAAIFSFSLAVYLGLQGLRRSPLPDEVEQRYFSKEKRADLRALAAKPVASAMVRITRYDGFSHARVFVNHRRVFESSVHCRFTHQCKEAPPGADQSPSPVACIPFQCTKGVKHLPVVMPPDWLDKARPISGSCIRIDASIDDLKEVGSSCSVCEGAQVCGQGRMVNWQIGIDAHPNGLPFEVNVLHLLRSGDNVIEVASENSGVGQCALTAELVLETPNGKLPPHVFKIDGPVKAEPGELGPRHGVQKSREPFTTCDRQRLKLRINKERG